MQVLILHYIYIEFEQYSKSKHMNALTTPFVPKLTDIAEEDELVSAQNSNFQKIVDADIDHIVRKMKEMLCISQKTTMLFQEEGVSFFENVCYF